jgi:glycosyltransferase involved in cell wall biosynthesis
MKISVIIPAYNAGKHIKRALDSVLGQSLSDIEVIVVNDGSTDDTAEIVAGYPDPRVKLVSQENGGTMAARKTGIGNFSGDYVLFCDADDLLKPDALQNLYSAAMENGADIVKGKVRILLEDGSDTGEIFAHELPYGNDRKGTILALWNNNLSHNLAGTLLKRTLLSGELVYFKRLSNGEDACLLYQFAERASVTILIPEVVADYFVYPDSLSHREFNEKILTDIFTANVFCYGIAQKYLEQDKKRNDRLIRAVRKSIHEYYPYRKLRRILKDTGYLEFVPLSVRLECLLECLKKKVIKKPFKDIFGSQV